VSVADTSTYDRIALTINEPLYDYYAGRILEKTGISTGRCLDIGCGGGYLGLALSRITSLTFLFMDKSPEAIQRANTNIASRLTRDRADTIKAEVQTIPLDDESFDLVISRGSIPFWDNLPSAFSEIRRVLKPHGRAYIGGGLGSPELRETLMKQVRQIMPNWHKGPRSIPQRENSEYREALLAAGLTRFTVTRSDEGMWIEFGKG
jgi:ubiquinone/menaquinone biosynthesis C-methylase UbiE